MGARVGECLEESGFDVGRHEGVSGGGGVDCLYEQIVVGVSAEQPTSPSLETSHAS